MDRCRLHVAKFGATPKSPQTGSNELGPCVAGQQYLLNKLFKFVLWRESYCVGRKCPFVIVSCKWHYNRGGERIRKPLDGSLTQWFVELLW